MGDDRQLEAQHYYLCWGQGSLEHCRWSRWVVHNVPTWANVNFAENTKTWEALIQLVLKPLICIFAGFHTVTAGIRGTSSVGKLFASKFLSYPSKFEYTYTQKGKFLYFCDPHPSMVGAITVIEKSPTSATTKSSATTSSPSTTKVRTSPMT